MNKQLGLTAILVSIWSAMNPCWGAEEELERWVSAQAIRSETRLFEAISPNGAALGSVMASPSTSEPNYYYHWIRDSALVMREAWETRSTNRTRALNTLMDYARFSRKNQLTANPSGEADGRGIGEPKFHMDGQPFNEGWGRPQNDGPALRARVLIDLGYELMSDGQTEWVRNVLYRNEMPARTVIKADLEYVAHHWREADFDLWEEISGKHFYTRMAQWRALDEGARFAAFLGDTAAAAFYAEQAKQIQSTFASFWSESRGYILATRDRTGGAAHKSSQLDTAVVLAVIQSGKAGTEFYVDDSRIMSTVAKLETVFGQVYAINSRTRDGGNLPMANAIGRYPEDTYNGVTTDGQGNPWFLTVHAMAEYYLMLEATLRNKSEIRLDARAKAFFSRFVDRNALRSNKIQRTDPSYPTLLKSLREQADRYLRRSRYHTAFDGHQSEQLNRNTGFMQGARDLTWSYASFLSMNRIRSGL